VPAVRVSQVRKSFGSTEALSGVDLDVAEGEVLALLGPNGAGKTTLVRVLATLLQPDGGSATIFGRDVVRDGGRVRRMIGLTGQYAAVDELLSGRENLRMFGELFHLRSRDARQRADELLERFDLVDAADRPAKTYSGGMRRRLDLASSLLVRPRLLFLDEPTTGLDPRSRNAIWEVTRELVAEGTTLLLTTQYLEEADQLADRIAVIDHGRIIAEGTGDQLKDEVGGQVVDIMLSDAADVEAALAAVPGSEQLGDARSLRVAVEAGRSLEAVGEVAGQLHAAGLEVRDLGLRRPTLDDVFLTLTDVAPPDSTEVAGDPADVAGSDDEHGDNMEVSA
jgi:daunorubicin resistance ABC transporter ATP-binding subunit